MNDKDYDSASALSTDWSLLIERKLDWSELDQLGHANNARYFTWFEEARMAYFERVGIPTDDQRGWGPILAQTECQFLAPVPWPSRLIIGARVTRIGNSSFTMEYTAHRKSEDNSQSISCVAKGSGVVVLIKYATGEKVRVNDEIRAEINSLDKLFSV